MKINENNKVREEFKVSIVLQQCNGPLRRQNIWAIRLKIYKYK